MSKIGIFYGSTTGNTEMVAQEIQKLLGEELVDLHDVESADKMSLNNYDLLLFGILGLGEDKKILARKFGCSLKLAVKKLLCFGVFFQLQAK